ncbi:MAG: class I SAM-dependent methyltransferase [Acidobacteria bacterium]|nr:class I SAM-dependent methyltransferase [Acidobacteriota bacterium]
MTHPRACPACGGTTTEYALPYICRIRPEDDIFTGCSLWSCSTCHTHFADPRPDPSMLAGYYEETYRKDGRNCASPVGFPTDNLWFLSRGISLAHLMRSVLPTPLPDSMPIIDVGAGYGHVIYALREMFGDRIEATAVEPDAQCHPTLSQVAKYVIASGITDEVLRNLNHARFHAALMLHVLEHVTEPLGFIESIRNIVLPGGILVIEVPHCPKKRVWWYNQDTPHVPHLTFFTQDGLKHLLKRAELDILLLDNFGPVFDADGAYDTSFAFDPVDPVENVKRGIAPPLPFPIFAESGPDRLFLRAIARK